MLILITSVGKFPAMLEAMPVSSIQIASELVRLRLKGTSESGENFQWIVVDSDQINRFGDMRVITQSRPLSKGH